MAHRKAPARAADSANTAGLLAGLAGARVSVVLPGPVSRAAWPSVSMVMRHPRGVSESPTAPRRVRRDCHGGTVRKALMKTLSPPGGRKLLPVRFREETVVCHFCQHIVIACIFDGYGALSIKKWFFDVVCGGLRHGTPPLFSLANHPCWVRSATARNSTLASGTLPGNSGALPAGLHHRG
jgi:hypothetical protein